MTDNRPSTANVPGRERLGPRRSSRNGRSFVIRSVMSQRSKLYAVGVTACGRSAKSNRSKSDWHVNWRSQGLATWYLTELLVPRKTGEVLAPRRNRLADKDCYSPKVRSTPVAIHKPRAKLRASQRESLRKMARVALSL